MSANHKDVFMFHHGWLLRRCQTFTATLALLGVSACASAHSNEYTDIEDQIAQIKKEIAESGRDKAAAQDTIYTEQVQSTDRNIDQLASDSINNSLQIGSIPGGDPCLWCRRERTACAANNSLRSPTQTSSRVSPEVELNVINIGRKTNEYDIEQTVNQIGRGQPITYSARAVGNDFLNSLPYQSTETSEDHLDEHPEPRLNHSKNTIGR